MTSSLGGDGASVPATASVSPSAKEPADRAERLYRKTKRKGRYHLVKHTWRTRPDPFAEVWPEVEEQLRKRPHLAAKTLFVRLQERYPGRFKDGQLRTMQRRVKAWRLQQTSFVAQEIGLVLSRKVEADDAGPVAASPISAAVAWEGLISALRSRGLTAEGTVSASACPACRNASPSRSRTEVINGAGNPA